MIGIRIATTAILATTTTTIKNNAHELNETNH